jgi:hypothetical protein
MLDPTVDMFAELRGRKQGSDEKKGCAFIAMNGMHLATVVLNLSYL